MISATDENFVYRKCNFRYDLLSIFASNVFNGKTVGLKSILLIPDTFPVHRIVEPIIAINSSINEIFLSFNYQNNSHD